MNKIYSTIDDIDFIKYNLFKKQLKREKIFNSDLLTKEKIKEIFDEVDHSVILVGNESSKHRPDLEWYKPNLKLIYDKLIYAYSYIDSKSKDIENLDEFFKKEVEFSAKDIYLDWHNIENDTVLTTGMIEPFESFEGYKNPVVIKVYHEFNNEEPHFHIIDPVDKINIAKISIVRTIYRDEVIDDKDRAIHKFVKESLIGIPGLSNMIYNNFIYNFNSDRRMSQLMVTDFLDRENRALNDLCTWRIK